MEQIALLCGLTQSSSPNRQTIESLIRLRDNLLLSLISQLTYNRIILNNVCFQSAFEPHVHPPQKVKVLEPERPPHYFPRRTSIPYKKNRKIIKPSSSSKSRLMSLKNDTKNIPKNYGKAILSFILKSSMTGRVTSSLGLNLPDFLIQIRKMKNRINSIDGLRKMWGYDQLDNKFKKSIRILSYQFMRKHCLRYIFYSKVRNFGTHIKYRQKLIQGIANPLAFNHIKDY